MYKKLLEFSFGNIYSFRSTCIRMMEKNCLYAILATSFILAVANALPPQKVVGGTPAYPGEIPYQVSLRYQGRHVCGGAIIGPRHVLTSAVCAKAIPNFNNAVVVTGSTKNTEGETHRVQRVLYHADWDRHVSGEPNDLALVALSQRINFNYYQNRVNLPSGPPPSRVTALVSGWGSLASSVNYTRDLTKAQVWVISASECHTILRDVNVIWTSQICTRTSTGAGTCSGDEGGPLVYNGQLIGIVSWGFLCGQGYPDVYTSVYHYLSWINFYVRYT